MFYDKYKELCIRNGESPFGVAKKLGISSRTQGNWKAGSEPRIGTLVKIAEYFGVDVSYFEEKYDMEEEDDVDAMREELKTNPDLRILLSASAKLNADDPRLLERMVLKVYMHVDIDICLLRRIKRDIKSRGRTIDNIAEQYVETVKPMYENYIQNYITEADFAIMRGGKNKMAIDCISAYLTTKVLAERMAMLGDAPKEYIENADED